MRGVAMLTNIETEFHAGAVLLIGLFYTVALLPGCLALAYSRAKWPWLVLAAGASVLGFEAVAIGLDEISQATGMSGFQRVGLALIAVAMLAAYVAQVVVAARWARSRPQSAKLTASKPQE
jgi:hypothetical protein